MNKYFNETGVNKYNITGSVWFKLLDKDGNIINDHKANICFAQITLCPIKKNVATVLIYHENKRMPYKPSTIKRWIADINELDFPCRYICKEDENKQRKYISNTITHSFIELAEKTMRGNQTNEVEDELHLFEIKLNDFKYKSHFISTLMLIRVLFEVGICNVPGIYLELMDKDPNADKFDMLQTAHKNTDGNTNHMITCYANGTNITSKTLWARYKECGEEVYTAKTHLGQSKKWEGEGATLKTWNY